jgi:hypothetical protein
MSLKFLLLSDIRLKIGFFPNVEKNETGKLNLKVDHFITVRFLQILKNCSL